MAEAVVPGDVVAGAYRIDGLLGEGSMAAVYAATQLADEAEVAIKILHPRHLRGEGQHLERFIREAKVAGKLDSPHAVKVFDVGTLDGVIPYFVMERLHGVDLRRHLERMGTLSVGRAADYLLQACHAVGEAHRLGIIHRDLKLANLFLARQPDGSERIKVIDFGVSKLLRPIDEEGQAAATTVVLGTPAFMAPEQMRSSKVDARADVWALGVTLYWLVTGKRPFEGESIVKIYESILKGPPPMRERVPGVPDELEALVRRALTWNPDERLPSVAAFASELRQFATGEAAEPIEAAPAMLATVEAAPFFPEPAPTSREAPEVAVDAPATPSVRPGVERRVVLAVAALALLAGAYALGSLRAASAATVQLFGPRVLPGFTIAMPSTTPPASENEPASAPPEPTTPPAVTVARPPPRSAPRPPPPASVGPKLAPPKQPKSSDEVWGMP